MVHCHCSTFQTSSSSLLFSTHSPGYRQPNHHRHSWLGRQPQQQAPQPASVGSQVAYAASASRLLTSSVPSLRRNVSVAAHHRYVDSVSSPIFYESRVWLAESDVAHRLEDQDLPVSLYWPYKNLPPDGQVCVCQSQCCCLQTSVLFCNC